MVQLEVWKICESRDDRSRRSTVDSRVCGLENFIEETWREYLSKSTVHGPQSTVMCAAGEIL